MALPYPNKESHGTAPYRKKGCHDIGEGPGGTPSHESRSRVFGTALQSNNGDVVVVCGIPFHNDKQRSEEETNKQTNSHLAPTTVLFEVSSSAEVFVCFLFKLLHIMPTNNKVDKHDTDSCKQEPNDPKNKEYDELLNNARKLIIHDLIKKKKT